MLQLTQVEFTPDFPSHHLEGQLVLDNIQGPAQSGSLSLPARVALQVHFFQAKNQVVKRIGNMLLIVYREAFLFNNRQQTFIIVLDKVVADLREESWPIPQYSMPPDL